ncbi:MAG TPA: hypothetical protein VFJ62_13140 [Usitatibacter sp.]|nr:hypothetical protein [Usitatibacter sp.]
MARVEAPWTARFGTAAAALVAYGAWSVWLTWPLVRGLRSTLFGDYGDTRGWGWWLWAKAQGMLDGPANPFLAAPFGTPNNNVISQPLSEGAFLALARAAGSEIAGINLFVMLSFPLTAFAAFIALRRLTGSAAGAFVGGAIFGFCPAAVMQATGGHSIFSFNAFVPLFLLALFANRRRRTLVTAAAVGLAFACIAFNALYFGYFALYLALYFALYDWLTREGESIGRMFRNYAACAFFAVVFALPVEVAAIHEHVTSDTAELAKAGHIRDFSQLEVYSARPLDYLLPPVDHVVLGRFTGTLRQAQLHDSNAFEQTLYLGVVPLALFMAGIALLALGRFEATHRRLFIFFVVGALWMYFVSMPPFVGGLPMPSWFGYHVAPMFRVYARAGMLVLFFLACAGSLVVAHIIASRRGAVRSGALVAALLVLLVVDYQTVPHAYARPLEPAPEVYRWLSRQGGDPLVAEYPMVNFDLAAFYTYPFWQRLHRKRLVNGAAPDNPPAWEFFNRVKDPSLDSTPRELKERGVSLVIVHADMYRDGPIPAALKPYYPPALDALSFDGGVAPPMAPGFKLLQVFGSDRVYTLP